MVNWYYVVGSERVGPVSFEIIKQLFLSKQINQETYVWKKGFQNWEKIQDVPELDFSSDESIEFPEVTSDSINELKFQIEEKDESAINNEESIYESSTELSINDTEVDSPVVSFDFDWSKLQAKHEIFFVRIDKDRKNYPGADIFGPYSKIELDEALANQRINLSTLIFAPGMSSWIKIQETPINQNYYPGITTSVSLNEIPVVLVFNHVTGPLSAVVKRAGVKDCQLLSSQVANDINGKKILASLYLGNELKVKNIPVQIKSYHNKTQVLDCHFIDLDSEAKKIMLNHAI